MPTIQKNMSKRLKGKDLIIIGIFSAVYFVIDFIFMLLSGLSPIIWILMPGLIALFTGVPYMIMVSKVQKPGAVFIMGAHYRTHLFWDGYVHGGDSPYLCRGLPTGGGGALRNKI